MNKRGRLGVGNVEIANFALLLCSRYRPITPWEGQQVSLLNPYVVGE